MKLIKYVIFTIQFFGYFKPLRFGLGVATTKWLLKHDSIGLCYDLCLLVPFKERQDCIDLIIEHEKMTGVSTGVVNEKISALDFSPQRSFWKNIKYLEFTSNTLSESS